MGPIDLKPQTNSSVQNSPVQSIEEINKALVGFTDVMNLEMAGAFAPVSSLKSKMYSIRVEPSGFRKSLFFQPMPLSRMATITGAPSDQVSYTAPANAKFQNSVVHAHFRTRLIHPGQGKRSKQRARLQHKLLSQQPVHPVFEKGKQVYGAIVSQPLNSL
jgi:hypothetical protein